MAALWPNKVTKYSIIGAVHRTAPIRICLFCGEGGVAVEGELCCEGFERRELSLGTQAADKVDIESGAVDVAREVDYMDLECAMMAADGGTGADVGHAAICCAANVGIDGIDAVGGEELGCVFWLYVGRGEADSTAEATARNHSAAYGEAVAKHGLGFSEVGFADLLAYQRTACVDVGAWCGRGDVVAVSYKVGASASVAADMVVEAHQQSVGAVAAFYFFDELRGREREILFAEVHYLYTGYSEIVYQL